MRNMGKKLTYQELVARVKELKRELNNLRKAERKWRESEETHHTSTEERLWVLSSIVEQSTEGMALSNLEGHLLFVNSAFAGMHGYTAEELVGKHLSVLHTAEQMPSVEAANRQLQEAGEFSGEIWHVRRDGTLFPTLMRNSVLRNEKGNPIGMIGTLRDITDLKRVEEALLESEEKYRNLFENTNDAIFIFDTETGIILDANKQTEQLIGCSKEQIIGMHQSELHPPQHAKYYKSKFRNHVQMGRISDVQAEVIKKDGSTVPVFISASTIRLRGKQLIQSIFGDASEVKKVEVVLTSTITKLEEAQKHLELLQQKNLENEKLGLFYKVVSFIAHDLKSSISVLSLVVRNCMEKIEGQAFLERAFETITRETEKMRQLMDTFSNLPPTLGLKFQKCNIIDLIANTLIRFEPFANVEIIQNLSHLPPVYGDGKALETVFFNVIKNSLEAMPRGGRLVIATDHIRAKNSVRISIADTGLGISEVYLNDGLFKPFSTTKDRGLGLGLYQSRDIVERHGGEIILKSQLNQGSECIIALPISR